MSHKIQYIVAGDILFPVDSSLQCEDDHTGEKADKECLRKMTMSHSILSLLWHFNLDHQCKESMRGSNVAGFPCIVI